MVANFIPLIMQGASDTMGILNKLFGGGGSSYNSDSAKAAKWQHNYNLAAMKQAQKYTLDQMAKTYNYNARGVKEQYKYNLALQKQAQTYDTDMYKKRYQMQIQDLKKAGINPLYGLGTAPAITAGANSVGAPTTGGGMSPLGSGLADLAGETNSKRLFKLNKIKTAAEISGIFYNNSALKAQAEKTKAETNTENINTLSKMSERLGIQLDNLEKLLRIENLPKEQKLDLEQRKKNIENTKANTDKAISDITVNNAVTENTKAETAIKKKEKEKIQKDIDNYTITRGVKLGPIDIQYHGPEQKENTEKIKNKGTDIKNKYKNIETNFNKKVNAKIQNMKNWKPNKNNPIFYNNGSYR